MGEMIRIVLAVFALYRLAGLISTEEGPYLFFLYKDERETGIFKRLRVKAGCYNYGPDGKPETNFARGLACPLCTAAYIAVPILVLMEFPTLAGNLFLAWLGIWGLQTYLENLTSDEAVQSAIQEVAESLEDNNGRSEN